MIEKVFRSDDVPSADRFDIWRQRLSRDVSPLGSVSYLHRIFQGEGITVSSWIREQRLANARRDLADPTLRSTPIHIIVSRWGFPRAADFSRAFRNAHGIPPKDYRDHTSTRLPPPARDTRQVNPPHRH